MGERTSGGVQTTLFLIAEIHPTNPSGSICVDESIYCWYGFGGKFVNKGLPRHVVEMERKLEDEYEI